MIAHIKVLTITHNKTENQKHQKWNIKNIIQNKDIEDAHVS